MSDPPNPIRSTSRRPRLRWLALGAVGLAGAVAVLVLRGPLFEGNLAVVDPGRVYRSAQPGPDVAETFRELGLASVLNLRGGSPSDRFYRDEVDAAARMNVDLYDLPMSATRRPSRTELLRLIDLFGACRYPILLHCKSGSDRTGLAACLYRMVVLNEPPESAESAFTVWRGHFPIFGPERLHEPIDEYADWLRDSGLPHLPARFRDWVARDYRSEEAFSTETEAPAAGSRWPVEEFARRETIGRD